jgi:hypothetical protein
VSGVRLDTALGKPIGSLNPAEEDLEFCTRDCNGFHLLSHLAVARILRLRISMIHHKTLVEVA